MTGPGEASLLSATADWIGAAARDGGGASSAIGEPAAGVGTTIGNGTGGGVVCGASETWVWAARGCDEDEGLGEEATDGCCWVALVEVVGVLEVEEVVKVVVKVEDVVVCSGGGGGGGARGGGG